MSANADTIMSRVPAPSRRDWSCISSIITLTSRTPKRYSMSSMQRRPSAKCVTLRCGTAFGPEGAGCGCTVGAGSVAALTSCCGVTQLAMAMASVAAMSLVAIMVGSVRARCG